MKNIRNFENEIDANKFIGQLSNNSVLVGDKQNKNIILANDEFNKYKMVDLGLSVKWCDKNVLANSAYEYGGFYAWGEVEEKDLYNQSFDNYFDTDDGIKFKKYNKNGITTLEPQDDAASVNMKNGWRMPTYNEMLELFDKKKITQMWIPDYDNTGIKGMLFISQSNGNSIFIPASGIKFDDKWNNVGLYAGLWTSSLYTANDVNAYYRGIRYDLSDVGYRRTKNAGFAIRAVHD